MTFKKGNHPRSEFKKGIIPWNKDVKGDKYKSHFKEEIKGTFKKGQIPWNKGKKGEYKPSNETKLKLSKIAKEKEFGKWMNGKKLSEKTKRKISLANKGKKHSKETKKKMSIASKGRKHSEETKRKMSIAKKGNHNSRGTEFKKGHKFTHSQETKEKIRNKLKGHRVLEETKKKLRLATIKYVREVCGGLHPMIGHNEKRILDELEREIGHKIIRQYQVEGYFLDGYIKELNLAIEVDERPKIEQRDIERQGIIEDKLNCEFLRINDFD
ncbi:MAG TPA: NUMOD3 domain-containing DNA-binding protein [Candidatus Paceibacterota bacterium]|nr:NUMOD3 domain-containing DNA-binding protein [Candidatus Paceibacterota bacterium]